MFGRNTIRLLVPRQGVRRLRENFERRSGSNRPYKHDQGSARTMAGRTLLTTSSLALLAGAGALLGGTLPAAAEPLTFVWHAGTCADAIVESPRTIPTRTSDRSGAGPLRTGMAQQDRIRIRDQGRRLRLRHVGQPVHRGIRRRRPRLLGQQDLRAVGGLWSLSSSSRRRSPATASIRTVRPVLGPAGQPGRLRLHVPQGPIRGSQGAGSLQG